ncbi:MBL fold metallo-hydrolase [Bacillus sp. FJAT-45037]|uniref:MBL fold metallo-hydrolase n=1 Tax=Bacillus sp. FJAT-45037 TaxID=2011007 RepID=UPI000C251533|nr:MBL fold metallo-hydrolase [Bacillus sp. FJAT-45037]
MKVTFLGGAGEYGRSCFLLQAEEMNVLIDCGVMKGGQTTKDTYPALTKEIAKNLSAVCITHAHEDHVAALPLLYHLGYEGEVYATSETISQSTDAMKVWLDREKINQKEIPFPDAALSLVKFKSLDELKRLGGLTISYGKSGHTSGSVWYNVEYKGKNIFFSGDYSFESKLLHYEDPICKNVDLAVLDGAYGDEPLSQSIYTSRLIGAIRDAIQTGKKVLIHGPLTGKTQDLLALLSESFNGQKDYHLVAAPKIIQSSKDAMQNKSWYKEMERHDVELFLQDQVVGVDVSTWLESTHLGVGFFQENDILQAHQQEKRVVPQLIITTGPKNKELQTLTKDDPNVNYEHFRYKVHPGTKETARLIKKIEPQKIVFTHGLNVEVRQLSEKLNLKSVEVVEQHSTIYI